MTAFEDLLIGRHPDLLTALRTAAMVAATDVTALILGESGTGKELLATAMHQSSRRAGAAFIAVNCAALPEALAESELFGHARGAFTGATEARPGRINAAQGGTLFLDEIGELPLVLQAKLLRFLESGECQAVGEARPRKADVRVIAATNRDLAAEVAAGRFRADLFYRLNVVPLELPALRARRSDIALLVEALLGRVSAQHGLARPLLAPETLKVLERHDWPGNVRELKNLCERLVILFAGRPVLPTNLPREILAERGAQAPGSEFDLPESGINLEGLERKLIRAALSRAAGNRSRAARLLGLTRHTLLYRMKKHAIEA